MPIIKSAKKRVRVTLSRSIQNAKTKKELRNSIKKFNSSLVSGKDIEDTLSEAQSNIDFAVKKGLVSKNKAARKKSQLNTAAKAASNGKRSVAKKTPKKTATKTTKKPAVKKSVAKKPTSAKKLAAKKPVK
jgi:small subunit ribosomal protein S20